MTTGDAEHTLEFLLAFDGRVHWYDQGYWTKFAFKRVASTRERPHGLRYALTLHDPAGKRLLGYDNAHRVRTRKGRSIEADHWHRSAEDPGTPYAFTDGATLIEDFFDEVERVLTARGVPVEVRKITEREENDT